MPNTAATRATTMRATNNTSETLSPANAWTLCTMPDREMNVPTITNMNAKHAHTTLQRLNVPCVRYRVKLCMRATHASHESRLAFSTGSQPQ